MLRVLFCGGGSIGHLAPSLAVWEKVKAENKQAEALFVCSRRSGDRSYLHTQGVRFASIDAPKWVLSPPVILFPLQLLLGLLETLVLLLTFHPTIIFSKGGYVSVPVCLMGWLLRIPIVLHESDRSMGKANRMLLRFARHLCVSAPQQEIDSVYLATRFNIPVTTTGNPIRAHLLRGSRDAGRSITGFSGKKPVLLVMGGSQGARALNEVVQQHLTELLDLCDIIHLTGPRKTGNIRPHARYFVREFADRELPDLYALADIVLSRAGASVIAEFAALGKATILVPLPHLAHGHQNENAHFLEVAGAAIVLHQKDLEQLLFPLLRELCSNEQKRRALGERLGTFAVPDAAEKIARVVAHEARERTE